MIEDEEDRPDESGWAGDDVELSDDPRIVEVVEAYCWELEQDRSPDREDFLNRYPDLSRQIEQCLDGLELLHAGGLGKRRRSAEGRSPHPADAIAEAALPNPLGDFQIIRELARGGMGIVYEAIQLSLGRRVALKVLPLAATLEPRRLKRFKIEAQAAALLHHSHIVPIYAVGCERGVHFYAMQLINGQSLAAVIEQLRKRENRPSVDWDSSEDESQLGSVVQLMALPVRQAEINDTAMTGPRHDATVGLSAAMTAGASSTSDVYIRRVAHWMIQAAEALQHAHQEGVVHRDIKPGNLLLGANGDVWVTDFGVAQLQADGKLTGPGEMLGTFRYMSPEQANGRGTVLDHRTDIYSLGVTFYELLALEPVFSVDNHQALLYQILHEEPHSLRAFNRAVPAELETVIFKAMRKIPAERYASAADFAADIQRYLDHRPIHARRPSRLDRTGKWLRRHPAVLVAAALLLIFVTAASLIGNRLIAIEQDRTAAALTREKLRADEVERQLRKARETADTLLQISEEELLVRQDDDARQQILEIVRSDYQEFIERHAGDAAERAAMVAVKDRINAMLSELRVLKSDANLELLSQNAVRQDLQLTADQQPQVQTLLHELEQQWSMKTELLEFSDEDRRRQSLPGAEQRQQALAAVLAPEQLQRFRQIAIQSQGISALLEPETAKALGLTLQQRSSIRKIERQMFDSRSQYPTESESSDADWTGKALELLTDEQLRLWEGIRGKPCAGLFTRHADPRHR